MPKTILAQNLGGGPAANESRTSDSKATRPGQIGMAATCGNGYVFDKLLKRRRRTHCGPAKVAALRELTSKQALASYRSSDQS